MPTSPYIHLQTYVDYLLETRPKSLLDVGLGNGKLGYIARDLLDVMLGECYRREEWKTRIDGIEVFPDYIQGHQREIYDAIYIGDAMEILSGLKPYDMIVVGDVLEHFHKDKAWNFLDLCMSLAEKHMILNIPLGTEWTQPEIYNNPYEKHRSFWTWEDLSPFVWKYRFFEIYPGTYSSMLIRKEDYLLFRYGQYINDSKSYGISSAES